MAQRVKWRLAVLAAVSGAAVVLIFGAGPLRLSIPTSYPVDLLLSAAFVVPLVAAAFLIVRDYERRLADATRSLESRTEALRRVEAERNTRLLDLSGDLALTVADIIYTSESARHLPEACDPMEALQRVETHAADLQVIIHHLVWLREQANEATEEPTRILEEYRPLVEDRARRGWRVSGSG
jgi:hypothetical protein